MSDHAVGGVDCLVGGGASQPPKAQPQRRPTLWLCLGGLAGAAAYKAINTADSMIGHLNERYAAFGFAAARVDDLVNLPASRLAAFLITAAACITPDAAPGAAWRAICRDGPRHRSPNAGYPESAMAGA